MENKESKQIYAILGGVIACFICLALVFLFPKGTSNLSKGNYNSLIPNNNEEEIALGDTSHCTEHHTNHDYMVVSSSDFHTTCPSNCTATVSGCKSAGESGYSCYCTISSQTGPNTYNGMVYQCEDRSYTVCTSCEAGYHKSSNECRECPDGKICPGGAADPVACAEGSEPNATRTECICSAGYELTEGTCSKCAKGSHKASAGNEACVPCNRGTYQDEEGKRNCKEPRAGYFCPHEGMTYDFYCAGTVNESKTDCTVHYCSGNEYNDMLDGSCKACPSGYTVKTYADSNNTFCRLECPSGQHVATIGGQCVACPTGYSSLTNSVAYPYGSAISSTTSECLPCSDSKVADTEKCKREVTGGAVCCCTSDKAMCSWMTACNSSKPSAQNDVKSETDCKSKESGIIPSTCTVSISINSRATSVSSDEIDNSYYTVIVNIKGNDCSERVVKYKATNAKSISKQSYTVPSGSVSSTVSFNVYPENPCEASTATATLDNGEHDQATLDKNSIRTDWVDTKDVCEKSPKYTTFYLADLDGANVYYSNYDEDKGCYTTKWQRNLCGSSTPDTPSTPSTPIPSDPEHCYIIDDGTYDWKRESAAKSTWKIADDEVVDGVCGPVPGCYMKISDGTYHVLQKQTEGYTYISSETDEKKCNPENYACYTKQAKDDDGNEYTSYKWANSQPAGYQKATFSKEECQNPACYVHGDDVDWGKYEGVVGYIKLEGVGKDECHIPGTGSDACYVGKDGNYVWGKYDDDSNYTLVPSVTDKAQCNNNVPVKPTGTSTSTIIYIFMAILMAFGIGFIYYSTVLNKNN